MYFFVLLSLQNFWGNIFELGEIWKSFVLSLLAVLQHDTDYQQIHANSH